MSELSQEQHIKSLEDRFTPRSDNFHSVPTQGHPLGSPLPSHLLLPPHRHHPPWIKVWRSLLPSPQCPATKQQWAIALQPRHKSAHLARLGAMVLPVQPLQGATPSRCSVTNCLELPPSLTLPTVAGPEERAPVSSIKKVLICSPSVWSSLQLAPYSSPICGIGRRDWMDLLVFRGIEPL